MFGVPESVVLENAKETVEGLVVTSLYKPTDVDEQAARMAFPSGAMIKRILGDKIFQKATEIISKCYNRENSFLLSFENQRQDRKVNPETEKLLDILNPQRRLYCLCVGTYDFTYCGTVADPEDECVSASVVIGAGEVFDPRTCASEIVKAQMNTTLQPDEIAVSQRVYCVSSYFPFFSFYEEVVLLLLNMLKVERLEIFQDQLEGLAHSDSRYHSMRIKELFELKMSKLMSRNILPDMLYQVRLLNETVSLDTKLESLHYVCLEESLYQVLSLFTLDTFLEVLSLCLLEDKLVFVCENSHILTYTVYLFVNVLVRPLRYAFASVYILPSEEFLSVPFPVVYGLLKKKKWIEQNRILDRFRNTYVFVTALGVYVHYTEKRDKCPVDKLKAQLSPLFKDLDRSRRLAPKPTCRVETNEYVQHSTEEERHMCFRILELVKSFIESEVIKWVPAREKMHQLKEEAMKIPIPKLRDSHTHVIGHIIKHIKDTRKTKDPFFNRVLHTQMLSMYFESFL